MVEVCQYCGGMTPNCPICGNPPPRKKAGRAEKIKNALYRTVLPLVTSSSSSSSWPVQGVDISAWNGVMDLSVTKTKAQYGFIRVGYGDMYKDRRCDTYRQDAIANDWPYGIYWFCYPQYSWLRHAQSFAQVASEYPFQLEMVIDAETTTLGKEETLEWFINLDEQLQNLTGKKPIIYTSPGFWNGSVAQSSHFAARLNWVAHWTYAQQPISPTYLPLWGHWQWEADGNNKAKEYGMIAEGDADIDLNRYHNGVSDFNTRYGTHIQSLGPVVPPPTPAEEIKPIKYVYVNTTALNMRSLPTVDSKDIGTVKLNDDLPVLEEKDGWLRVSGWINKSLTRPKI